MMYTLLFYVFDALQAAVGAQLDPKAFSARRS